MATRRAHNKSRLGCHQCKRRRIKCDVKQPSCANCNKKGLECSFLLLAPTSHLSVVSPTSSETSRCSRPSPSPLPGQAITSTAPSPRSEISYESSSSHEVSLVSCTSHLSDQIVDNGLSQNVQQQQPYCTNFLHPESTIPQSLRFHDPWHDVRTLLPSPLQEVLAHYEFTTSLTLASNDPAKAAWQAYVPEMATRYSFLLNCVLSVASLHLGRLYDAPSNASRMNTIAAARMNKAIAAYRPELEHLTQKNATALFATVTLTAVYLIRTSALDIENLCASIPQGTQVIPPDISEKLLSCVIRTMHGLRGPMAVLMNGWSWVVGGRMNPVAARKWWPKHRDRVPATARAIAEDERLCGLAELWKSSAMGEREEHLDLSLHQLRETFALVSQLTVPEAYLPVAAVAYSVDDANVGVLTDRGAVFVWATLVTREFLVLLDSRDRDALVLYAHYAILFGRFRNVWWMESTGADIVTAIALHFSEADRKLIEWPASVVGVDLKNILDRKWRPIEVCSGDLQMSVI